MKQTLVLLCLLITTQAHSLDSTDSVGFRWHSTVDTSRPHWTADGPRPMLINSFYPTDREASSHFFGPPDQDVFIGGNLAHNAPLGSLQTGEHPLVILSHGNGSGVLQLSWLAQQLVAEGFIVIGVNHHGNTYIEPYLPQGFTHYWERPQDVLFALEWALSESPFKEYIDQDKIALVGYSLGGYTVLANAGAATDRDYFINEFCQSPQKDATCSPGREMPNLREAYSEVKNDEKVLQSLTRQHNSVHSKRFKAVVAISPPGHLLAPESLGNIQIPTLIAVGNKDKVTPAASNAAYLASNIRNATYHEITDALHYSMLSLCTPQGIQIMPPLCADSPHRARVDIHREVAKLATDFLTQQLHEKAPSLAPDRITKIH